MKPTRPKTDRSAPRSPAPARTPAPPAELASPPDGSPAALDLRLIRELAQVVSQFQLTEISLELGGGRVRLRRAGAEVVTVAAPAAGTPPPVIVPVAAIPAPAPAAAPAAPAPAADLVEVTSPIVGTFYRSPNPDAAPYVEVGTRIRKGQILCIVEAMKLMNEIEAEVNGTIVEILGQNGVPVEYGEPLFRVRAE